MVPRLARLFSVFLSRHSIRIAAAALALPGTVLWAAQPAEEVADMRALQATIEFYREGRADEAVNVWRQLIREGGSTIKRQEQLCSTLTAASDLGGLRDCLEQFSSMLEMHATAASGVSAPGRAKNRNEVWSRYHSLTLGYSVLGDYPRAIATAKSLLQVSEGTYRPIPLRYLASYYGQTGDLEALRKVGGEIESLNARTLAEVEGKILREVLLAIPNISPEMVDKNVTEAVEKAEKNIATSILGARLAVADALKDYGAALRIHEAMFPELQSFPNQDAASRAWIQFGRASYLIRAGRAAEAKSLLDFAGKNNPMINGQWSYEHLLGQVAEQDGDKAEAIRRYKTAIELIESIRAKASTENDKIGALGSYHEIYTRLVALLIQTGAASHAFEYAERGKARALVDMLASKDDLSTRSAGVGGVADTKSILADLRRAELPAPIITTGKTASHDEADKKRNIAVQIRERLRQEDPELASLVSVVHLPADEFRKILRADETLIEYFGDDRTFYAFVVTREKITAVTLDPGVLAQVAAFRQSVQRPASLDSDALAIAMYQKLIAPLSLPAGGLLTVVPHGSLHYLPFSALSNGKSRLIDRYSVRVSPSASVLPMLAARARPSNRSVLVFGNPDLGDKQYDLPGAQKEAQEIARLQPGNKLLLRGAASKAAVLQYGAQYGYVHFASHGTFDALKPRQSGLLLANKPGSNSPTDGMLTVDELYSLRLDADLVTLSACETALGNIQSGDDVIGLTRGFFYAGAHSIVSSLWEVDDKATEQLMVNFYRFLPKNSKADALRLAQLEVKKRFPHPFYWAAFQLAGNDGETKATGTTRQNVVVVPRTPADARGKNAPESSKQPEESLAANTRSEAQVAWAAAQKTNTRAAYSAYLREYPEGQFVTAAIERARKLPWATPATIKDCDICPELVAIPAASTMIREGPATPAFKVNFAKAFAIGKYQVTFDQWDACQTEGACGGQWIPGFKLGAAWAYGDLRENRPVVNVNLDDTMGYLRWLSAKTGKKYRLASYAEWAYVSSAASALSGEPLIKCADGSQATDCEPAGGGNVRDHWPVDTFLANELGIHDVQNRNVAFWLADCRSGSSATPAAGSFQVPQDGTAWAPGPCDKQLTSAGHAFESQRDAGIGIRIVRDYP